ncbi:TRAP transporter small permease [Oribacterium sp. WCC10]|uniref:TRAP transporter small permease n=1 Tax=Oribacterium sp. WCC10 TaxID=1855343 RepID=UPI0008E3B524|nr:TRAP transporter small permease [Oribacterium sp. WCC10]SFG51632.1 TRAP-type C4-dicarboxylate transport system, small permease component [Oribacterium sp. WCC10]
MESFFRTVDKAKPIYDAVYKFVLVLCKILLIGDIVLVSFAVLARYLDFIPHQAWVEEVVLTLMSYMAVLSASLAIRSKAHIRMTAFDRYLPESVIIFLDILADVFVLILAVIMMVVGWQYASTVGSKGTFISITWLSRAWYYYPIPIAGVAMFIFELESIYGHFRKIFIKDEKKEVR